MSKYASNDVMDLFVYHNGELVYKSDTVKSYKLGKNRLIIEDALIDLKLMKDVLEGKYENRVVTIVGKTSFRGLDGLDKNVTIGIDVAELYDYNYSSGLDNISIPTIKFSFDEENFYGDPNFKIVVGE